MRNFFLSFASSVIFSTTLLAGTVDDAQRMLNQLGYSAGAVDGAYGRKTKSALKKFYSSIGAEYDGTLDANEIADLKSEMSKRTKSDYVNEQNGPKNAHMRIYKDSTANKPYELTISDKFARTGKTSQRFEVRHGDCGIDFDCDNDRRRVELSEGGTGKYHASIGDQMWYGYSIYLPDDFDDLYSTNTHLGQMMHGGKPIWAINFKYNNLKVEYVPAPVDITQACIVAKTSDFVGKWTDLVIYADYSYGNENDDHMFKVWIDDKLVCTSKKPFMHPKRTAKMKQERVLKLRYGIYNSYISRYHTDGLGDILPTQVVYYDNVRIGNSRESVDVNFQN